ncbi:MAG TPA: hypothetical protein VG322_17190 [Candidatus Acidoferrales bacterium]|nr:hypothetical protein [Candidatus Acidoferrales bacterium]
MCRFAFAALLLVFFGFGAVKLNSLAPGPRATRPQISLGPGEGAFLILSDVHFDPFTGTDPHVLQQLLEAPADRWSSIFASQPNQPPAPDGSDTNYALFSSALDASRNSGVHYGYVLMPGDFLGHNFQQKYRHYAHPDGSGYEEFVLKTMTFVSRSIQQAFPSLPVYFAFGNNDSVIDDYAPQGASLLAAMDKEWKTLPRQPSAKKDFLASGYYVVPHPTVPDFDFIVLNTAPWSSHASPVPFGDADTAELTWFSAQLDRTRLAHHSAALLMHIPPGIDGSASSNPGQCATPTFFFKKSVEDSFLSIVAAHKDVLRDSYAGHIHIDNFRVLSDQQGMPYFQTHIAPAVSRDHHTPPGFDIGVYDKKSGAMVDYAADYEHDIPSADGTQAAWKIAYDFREESHFPNYSPSSLQTLALLVRSSDAIRARIMHIYGGRSNSALPVPVQDWRYYSCAQTDWDAATYSQCACPSGAGPK